VLIIKQEDWLKDYDKIAAFLRLRLSQKDIDKINRIDNHDVHAFIARYIDLCDPSTIAVYDDSNQDIRKTREAAIRFHEEASLAIAHHTIHFDGYYDQARDKKQTKFLIPNEENLGPELNSMKRQEGLDEIHDIMRNIMNGHQLHIKFYCLGPLNSPFSIPCVQLTDSAYVAHSEDLLYRQGYQEFIRRKEPYRFFKFVHSAGALEPAGLGLLVSKNIDKRRIYIDLEDNIVYSANTQYGGNTIGLKKLAMRLAIHHAYKEKWLTEHMLLMGVGGPNGRVSYFTGAFPSMCGKTSTAMVKGETVLGDDIAYLRSIDGEVRGVNVESGIFGIIEGINPENDPIQWNILKESHEIIFTNQLVTDERMNYWNGKPGPIPRKGVNHSGEWFLGKIDESGNKITPSHKNARFTFRLEVLDNVSEKLHDPYGVRVDGFIYGGRDSDTSVPLKESFNWTHGIIMYGSCLESETTAATLGKEGQRVFNPMSNIDFLSLPIGRYIQNNLDFGKRLRKPPHIFAVNYFLRDLETHKFLNGKDDKRVWLKWIELRVHGEIESIKTPTGYIPRYKDLQMLFNNVLDKEYHLDDYLKQFTLRIPENLSKIDRMINVFTDRVTDTPSIVFQELSKQKQRLQDAQMRYGDYVSPQQFI
jgi:phosphoenolpyruvate carboxykinase (GTP)